MEGVEMLCESRPPGQPARLLRPAAFLAALVLLVCPPVLAADPVNQSVSPNSGTLPVASNLFVTVTHTDSLGGNNISGSYLILNSVIDGANGVYLFYDGNVNQLKLRNDANTAWIGGVTPGVSTVLENSRCKVYVSQCYANVQGNTLTLQWCIELKTSMAGRTLNAYVYSTNKSAGKDGWDQFATYTAGPAPTQSPSNASVSPASGSVQINTPTMFTGVYSDPDGAANLSGCYLLANTTLSGVAAVYVWYDANNNRLWIRNDANTAWEGGFAPGWGNTIENSQFILYCDQTSVTRNGNNLTINWKIELKPATMGASVKAWMYCLDKTGAFDGWDQKGAWSIVTDNDTPGNFVLGIPARVPAGYQQQFEAIFRDLDGADDLTSGYILINTSLNGGQGVYIWADALTGKFWLRNDANTAWLGGYEPGTDITVENSRCRLNFKDISVYADGNDVSVYLWVTFKPLMAGQKYTAWMYAADQQGANSGFVEVNTFTVYQPQPPVNVGVQPAGGVLLSNTVLRLKTTQSDPNGPYNIKSSYLLLDEILDGANACYLWFDAANWKLYLRNDQNTAWLGGVQPGWSEVVENSTVKLHCDQTVVRDDANSMEVHWFLEFKTPAAPRNVNAWLYATNWYNLGDGWDQIGSFTITPVNPSTAEGRLQTLISSDGVEIDPCAEFDWFDAYNTAHPSDKTGILGWSIARVACAVSDIESKYGVSSDAMASIASFQTAVTFAASGEMAKLASVPVGFVTGHGADALKPQADSAESRFTVKPASSDELTPAALAADIKNDLIPALQEAISALAPIIADTSFLASFTVFDGQTGHIRTEEVQMYRAALETVLALLSTAVAYSWDDTGFDWARGPNEMDANLDGLLTPAEYLPGGSFGTLVDAAAITTGWNALNAALDDAMDVAENGFAVADPDQFLQMVKSIDWGMLLGALDEVDQALSGRIVVPYEYSTGVQWHRQWHETFVTVDLSRFWLNPITNLRALAPTMALRRTYYGEPYVQVVSIPDPTMNGIFPRGAWQIPIDLWNYWFGEDEEPFF